MQVCKIGCYAQSGCARSDVSAPATATLILTNCSVPVVSDHRAGKVFRMNHAFVVLFTNYNYYISAAKRRRAPAGLC